MEERECAKYGILYSIRYGRDFHRELYSLPPGGDIAVARVTAIVELQLKIREIFVMSSVVRICGGPFGISAALLVCSSWIQNRA